MMIIIIIIIIIVIYCVYFYVGCVYSTTYDKPAAVFPEGEGGAMRVDDGEQ